MGDWCCTDCCIEDQEPGILSGVEREIPGYDETLTTYFHKALHERKILPGKVALACYDKKLSFNALQFQSTKLAGLLKKRLGSNFQIANPDDDLVISLCLPPSEKLIVLIFAILKLGGTYLPLDPKYPLNVILQILKSFRPIIVIHSGNHLVLPTKSDIPDIVTTGPFFICLEELWQDLAEVSPNKNPIPPDTPDILKDDKLVEILPLPQETRAYERPAVIIHTTGLHNVPRGVRLSHTSIMNRIAWTWKNLPFAKNGSCALIQPITFVESLSQIFGPLLKGITLHIYNTTDLANMGSLINNLEKDKVTRLSLSPVALGKFMNECRVIGRDDARMKLRLLKYVSCKGEILTYDLAKKFFECFPADGKTLLTMYGYTELSGEVICEKFKNLEQVRRRIVAGHIVLGRVMDNTKIYIMNVNHELAVNLEQGQFCVGGTPLAMGYLNKKTRDFNFINNPYDTSRKYCRLFLTGDFGRFVICKDRRFRLLLEGRGDSFLRHNGYEFVIQDIKEVLKAHEGVEHVNIFIFHAGKPDQSVLAFVLPKPNFTLSNAVILEYLEKQVPTFMIPTVRVVQSFPMLENGRLDRHQILQDYLEGRDSGFDDWGRLKIRNTASLEAGKLLLEALYKFCSIPVKISIKSMKSSFFALGGNSCNTVCLVLYLNKKGFPISIQDFIGAETIEDLINLMENRRTLHKFRRSIGHDNNGTTEPAPDEEKQDAVEARPVILLAQDSRATQLYSSKYMEPKHQKDVMHIISSAYTRHGDLEKISLVQPEEWISFLNANLDVIMEQQLCFVIVRNLDLKVVGAALCYDFFTDFDTSTVVGPLKYILEFIHEVKGQVLDRFDEQEREAGSQIYECFAMGTLPGLSPGENIRVTVYMMNEIVRRATADGFKSIYIASTNQLIRELLLRIFQFKLWDDYVVNEYKDSDGIRPFHLAPGTVTMSSYYKSLKPVTVVGDTTA